MVLFHVKLHVFGSRFASLGIAFGIAGSVFVGACGFALKYISGKVEEEKARRSSE